MSEICLSSSCSFEDDLGMRYEWPFRDENGANVIYFGFDFEVKDSCVVALMCLSHYGEYPVEDFVRDLAVRRAEMAKEMANQNIIAHPLFAADLYTLSLFLTHTQANNNVPLHIFYSNRAEAFLRAKKPEEAIISCDLSLMYDTTFAKTHRRKERAKNMIKMREKEVSSEEMRRQNEMTMCCV
jgi:hypothetical protein